MGLTENPKGQSEKANTIQIVDPEVYADGITKTYIEKNISSEKGIVKYNQWKQLSEGQYDEII
jgi:hypothetical protein